MINLNLRDPETNYTNGNSSDLFINYEYSLIEYFISGNLQSFYEESICDTFLVNRARLPS